MNMKFLKIGYDNPARIHVMGQVTRVTPRLHIRGKHGAIRLLVTLSKVDILTFLFNQHTGFPDKPVNKAGMA